MSFDKSDIPKVLSYWDEILRGRQWTEGRFTQLFEEHWSEHNNLASVAFSSWSGAALTLMEYFKLAGETVLVPSNTFMATPLSVLRAGANVKFVDCNRFDLCMSLEDLKEKARLFKPKAVWVVHIGGHIAFEVQEIAAFCREQGIFLFEDCAHAHGATWNGLKPGQWGDAGVYSFYATKTCTTGEGGMLVTQNKDLADFGRKFRNYGKHEYDVHGLNFRMNEFTAALGLVQVERLDEVVRYKNEYARKLDQQFENRVRLPQGMVSGYYKYIVFDKIEKSTGKVYDRPCHRILGHDTDLPNSDWIAQNHWCVPIYFHS